MITFVRVEIGSGGLPVCPECGEAAPQQMRPIQSVISDVRRAIETWPEGPGPNVTLDGADAFAHPDLPTLVSDALRAGAQRLRLTTAGPALAHGMNAAGVLDAGIRHIEVVVLGPDQGDRIGSGAAPFGAVLAGMAAFTEAARERGAGVAVVGRVLACPHTMAAAPATVAALGAAGAVAITVRLCANGRYANAAWTEAVIDSGVVNRAWVQFETSAAAESPSFSPLSGVSIADARAWRDVGSRS